MGKRVKLELYTPFEKKICDLYDSSFQVSGQASNLSIKKNSKEIFTISFDLPLKVESETGEIVDNFRCDNIKNENLLYYTFGDKVDVYKIKTCEDSVAGRKSTMSITGLHRCENLKTRGLSNTYDQTTQNVRYHMDKILEGTGWTVDTCEDFYEDGIFEKTFELPEGFVPTPSDMSFGSYAEVLNLYGHSNWSSGWKNSTVKIVSIGKNLFDGLYEIGHINASGAPDYQDNANRYRSINYAYVKPFVGKTIVLSGTGFYTANLFWYDAEFNLLSTDSSTKTKVIPSSAVWMKFTMQYDAGGTTNFTVAPSSIQLELTSATTYEKYMTPYEINIADLGTYDFVNRSSITRATGYNDSTHSTYEKDPVVETLSPSSVRLYPDGIVYIETSVYGSSTCSIAYSVEDSEGATLKEKVRSYTKESGTTSYDALREIETLFDGYLVFDGYNKKVSFKKIYGKDSKVSYHVDKNMNSIKKTRETSDYITRLYVINQTSDAGYIGIENVNPIGTSFIINFDYLQDSGYLGQAQIDAIELFKTNMKTITRQYKTEIDEMYFKQNSVNTMVGQSKIAFAEAVSLTSDVVRIGSTVSINACGDPETDDIIYGRTQFNTWQKFNVVSFNASSRDVTLSGYPISCTHLLWYKNSVAGKVGAKIISIDTDLEEAEKLQAKYDESDDQDEKNELMQQIQYLENEVDILFFGDNVSQGLHTMFTSLMLEVNSMMLAESAVATSQAELKEETATFEAALGDAVKDGIFAQGDYANGQDLALYSDALKFLHEASMPKVEYTVDAVEMSKVPGYEIEEVEFGDVIYITEQKLGIENLEAQVTAFTESPMVGKLNVFNVGNYKESNKWMEDINATTKKLKAKAKIYERARSIDPNGDINVKVLSSSINSSDIGSSINISANESLQDVATSSEVKDMIGYNVVISSTNGNILTDDIRDTVVRARVYRGKDPITYLIPAANFKWKRTSADAAGDAIWNADPTHIGVKYFTLTAIDIKYAGNITCNVSIPD